MCRRNPYICLLGSFLKLKNNSISMLMSIWLCFCLTQHQVSTDNLVGGQLAETAFQMFHWFLPQISVVSRWATRPRARKPSSIRPLASCVKLVRCPDDDNSPRRTGSPSEASGSFCHVSSHALLNDCRWAADVTDRTFTTVCPLAASVAKPANFNSIYGV